MTSLYIHIPFCLRKCHYCSFSSYVTSFEIKNSYLLALRRELKTLSAARDSEPLSTLFFGGGTPTCVEMDGLTSLVGYCKELFAFEDDAEISVEANPGTVDEYYLEQLQQSGVNRLSLGVQSFIDAELSKIGRLHDKNEAVEAYAAAKKVGFTNINIDLMYGLPGQTVASWSESLDQAYHLHPQHLSLYQMIVEEGTHFGSLDAEGKLTLPDEDEIIKMDGLTESRCRNEHYIQYETSNFALYPYQCRHNINYWDNLDYLAVGAAAVSYVAGVREKRLTDPTLYIDAIMRGDSAVSERECLDSGASFRETVIMGLRMKKGVSLLNLQSRYGLTPLQHYGTTLNRLLETGMMELSESYLYISKKGWPLSNQIMAELV